MNSTFKVVFNKARGALMVVNEVTSSVQAKGTKTVVATAVAAMISGVAGTAVATDDPAYLGSEASAVITWDGATAKQTNTGVKVGSATEAANYGDTKSFSENTVVTLKGGAISITGEDKAGSMNGTVKVKTITGSGEIAMTSRSTAEAKKTLTLDAADVITLTGGKLVFSNAAKTTPETGDKAGVIVVQTADEKTISLGVASTEDDGLVDGVAGTGVDTIVNEGATVSLIAGKNTFAAFDYKNGNISVAKDAALTMKGSTVTLEKEVAVANLGTMTLEGTTVNLNTDYVKSESNAGKLDVKGNAVLGGKATLDVDSIALAANRVTEGDAENLINPDVLVTGNLTASAKTSIAAKTLLVNTNKLVVADKAKLTVSESAVIKTAANEINGEATFGALNLTVASASAALTVGATGDVTAESVAVTGGDSAATLTILKSGSNPVAGKLADAGSLTTKTLTLGKKAEVTVGGALEVTGLTTINGAEAKLKVHNTNIAHVDGDGDGSDVADTPVYAAVKFADVALTKGTFEVTGAEATVAGKLTQGENGTLTVGAAGDLEVAEAVLDGTTTVGGELTVGTATVAGSVTGAGDLLVTESIVTAAGAILAVKEIEADDNAVIDVSKTGFGAATTDVELGKNAKLKEKITDNKFTLVYNLALADGANLYKGDDVFTGELTVGTAVLDLEGGFSYKKLTLDGTAAGTKVNVNGGTLDVDTLALTKGKITVGDGSQTAALNVATAEGSSGAFTSVAADSSIVVNNLGTLTTTAKAVGITLAETTEYPVTTNYKLAAKPEVIGPSNEFH